MGEVKKNNKKKSIQKTEKVKLKSAKTTATVAHYSINSFFALVVQTMSTVETKTVSSRQKKPQNIIYKKKKKNRTKKDHFKTF